MKTIAILATDDFEDAEMVQPYDRLKASGYKVLVVGTAEGKIIVGKRGQARFRVDLDVASVDPADFDALVIPGGYSPDRLRTNQAVVDFVRDFVVGGRPVAAICHGPQLLITAGVLGGRRVTGWSSIKVDLENAGADFIDQPVVMDGNLITSRKPADVPQFVGALIGLLEGEEKELSA